MTKYVGQYDTEFQAHLALLLLDQHGIRAAVVGGSLTWLEGFPRSMFGVQLLVADADYERAERLLAGEKQEEPG
jgi:hypothetical protein